MLILCMENSVRTKKRNFNDKERPTHFTSGLLIMKNFIKISNLPIWLICRKRVIDEDVGPSNIISYWKSTMTKCMKFRIHKLFNTFLVSEIKDAICYCTSRNFVNVSYKMLPRFICVCTKLAERKERGKGRSLWGRGISNESCWRATRPNKAIGEERKEENKG